MPRALGSFDRNWTLRCVCDDCNAYFANTLELPLGRDSREALLRIDLGLKPASGAKDLLNRRISTTLSDSGQFKGIRMRLTPSEDGTEVIPVPVPQVSLRRQGNEWQFFTESELTANSVRDFIAATDLEIGIYGVGSDCDRLMERLATLGIDVVVTRHLRNQPITESSQIAVACDITVDEVVVRAACKIAFNYATKILGPSVVRRPEFDAARRFVRYGEAPVQLATVQQMSVLVGPGAELARVHACALGWDRGYLVGLVSLFNEITYAIRLCEAAPDDFAPARHFFDPLERTISEAGIES